MKEPTMPVPIEDFGADASRLVVWNISLDCNYRCAYCSQEHARRKAARAWRPALKADAWIAHWRRFYDRFGPSHAYILGGEPFVFPGFLNVLASVSRDHRTCVSTNLSWELGPFLDRMDPHRVCLRASLHPDAPQGLDDFLDKVSRLGRAGFACLIRAVAYPQFLPRLAQWRDSATQAGASFLALPFRGMHGGRLYPDAYTEEERTLLTPMLTPRGAKYLLNLAPTRGKLCACGVNCARLLPDGTVLRCMEHKAVLGRFDRSFFKRFDFWKEARPCPSDYCSTCESQTMSIEGEVRGPRPSGTCSAATRTGRGSIT